MRWFQMVPQGPRQGVDTGLLTAHGMACPVTLPTADFILLAPQDPLTPSQTPLMKRRTMMTSEQPSLGP